MKLSDIKGDRVLDVIADIIDPIANMAQDKDVAAMFERKAVPEGMDAREFFAERMRKGLPVLLKSHKADIIAIMAAIEGVTPEQYAASLDFPKLFTDVMELVTDDALLDFLSSSGTGKDADAPGSVSVSSGAH
jgi:hypothetical protein|nr:MAG TPA: hypothetical protein [Caudoviricetes sp.]